MNEQDKDRQAQPWHPADEKPGRHTGGPIGTHSLTGGGAEVGLPPNAGDALRSDVGGGDNDKPHDAAHDALLEPRAQRGGLLGS